MAVEFLMMSLLRKNFLVIATVLLVSAAVSCSEKENKNQAAASAHSRLQNAPLQAEGFVVRTRVLSENLGVPGTLLPFETTEIRAEISGRIVQLNIPEGKEVKKGSVLVRLFDEDLQAQLKKLQVQLSIAEKTTERQGALLKINGISQQEFDLSELSVNNLKADIQLVQVSIDKTRILAPYDGRLGLRNVSLGAYVTPADVLTSISQVSSLKLEFTVPEKYSESMVKGKQVDFTIGGSDKDFTASVIATESTIEANTRSLKVKAVVKSSDPALVPGGFAEVSLDLDKNNKALVVPTQAVIPQARDKRVALFHGGTPEFRVVKTGIRDSTYVQITDGLKAGDTVIISGLLAIRPESKVQLTRIH